MSLTAEALREFVASLQSSKSLASAPDEVVSFASRAGRLSPRELVAEATALERPADLIARVVVSSLQSILGDIEEHGAAAEFAGDRAFAKKALTAWRKRAGKASPSDAFLDARLEEELVAGLEFAKLPRAHHAAWMKLKAARSLAPVLDTLTKKKLEPWFAELCAAYVAHELKQIAKSRQASSWQSKLADVPRLLALLLRLGPPPLFGPRALRAANAIVLRHSDEKTRIMLLSMGALREDAGQKREVDGAKRRSDVMARAVALQRAAFGIRRT